MDGIGNQARIGQAIVRCLAQNGFRSLISFHLFPTNLPRLLDSLSASESGRYRETLIADLLRQDSGILEGEVRSRGDECGDLS